MKIHYKKVTLAASGLAVCAIGVALGVTSVSGWTILAGLALLPTIVTLPLWSDPPQTMSESIQQARR